MSEYRLLHLFKKSDKPYTQERHEKKGRLRERYGFLTFDIVIALAHTGDDEDAAYKLLRDAYGEKWR